MRVGSSIVIFRISQVNSALTDLLFCFGRISSSSSDGSGWMCVNKQKRLSITSRI